VNRDIAYLAFVIPAKARIQDAAGTIQFVDTGVCRCDG